MMFSKISKRLAEACNTSSCLALISCLASGVSALAASCVIRTVAALGLKLGDSGEANSSVGID